MKNGPWIRSWLIYLQKILESLWVLSFCNIRNYYSIENVCECLPFVWELGHLPEWVKVKQKYASTKSISFCQTLICSNLCSWCSAPCPFTHHNCLGWPLYFAVTGSQEDTFVTGILMKETICIGSILSLEHPPSFSVPPSLPTPLKQKCVCMCASMSSPSTVF